MEMMEKDKSMWDGHLGQNTVAEHSIFLNSSDVPPILFVPFRAGPKEGELEREEIEKMQEDGVAKPVVTE